MTHQSIWEKSEERSIAKKYLHGNFQSGHRTPNEHYLSRGGLRGRKRWICFTLFFLVYLLALAHLVLTCFILGVLRFNFEGSPYFDFQEDGSLTFSRGANLSSITLAPPSTVHSHSNQSLTVTGTHNDKVAFRAFSMERLSLDSSSVNLMSDGVRVYTSSSDGSERQLQLSVTDSSVEMSDLLRANRLKVNRLTTNTVANVSGVSASGQVLLTGAVGVTLQGTQVDISAQGDVSISSQEAISIATERVFLSGLSSSSVQTEGTQYHLCCCANGQLFLVESNPQRCAASHTNSPCT